MGFISSIFKPSATPISTAPLAAVEDASKKTKKLRSALLSTEGGIAGQEIFSGGVSSGRRETLFGN